jgi:hypothetical protein
MDQIGAHTSAWLMIVDVKETELAVVKKMRVKEDALKRVSSYKIKDKGER